MAIVRWYTSAVLIQFSCRGALTSNTEPDLDSTADAWPGLYLLVSDGNQISLPHYGTDIPSRSGSNAPRISSIIVTDSEGPVVLHPSPDLSSAIPKHYTCCFAHLAIFFTDGSPLPSTCSLVLYMCIYVIRMMIYLICASLIL